jgi:hypothetical protein
LIFVFTGNDFWFTCCKLDVSVEFCEIKIGVKATVTFLGVPLDRERFGSYSVNLYTYQNLSKFYFGGVFPYGQVGGLLTIRRRLLAFRCSAKSRSRHRHYDGYALYTEGRGVERNA